MRKLRTIGWLLACASTGHVAAPSAQTASTSPASPSVPATTQTDDASLEDIVVTASKTAAAQRVQDVPFAVTAFGPAQLDDQHVQNLQGLSYSVPSVQIEDVGTTPGTANLSIRGLGINSSIPSIDPTVGIFVDGVYLGVTIGALFDTFDLEGVEVLRGPQGLLFGRNVTGGALVVRTTRPTNTFHVDARASVASGPEKTVSAVVSGPLIADRLSAKVAVYYNHDSGYFRNLFNGDDNLGRNETLLARAALRFTPSTSTDLLVRYEHGRQRGDGAVASNHGLFARDSFNVSINDDGFSRVDWDQAIVEDNVDVGFGNGRITNVFGYRSLTQLSRNDIDASPQDLFVLRIATDQNQVSNELRYAGTFGPVEVTSGLYYFHQNITYYEGRRLRATTILGGAGFQSQNSYGIFASGDWHFTPTLTLNAGARYTIESKDVQIANIVANGCNFDTRACNITFRDKNTWRGLTPRVGLQYQPSRATEIYGYYARGFRSGGYNFRNLSPSVQPGPFDQEKQDSFEIGWKQDIGRTARFNLAAYSNKIHNVQREIQTPVPSVGVFVVIANAADATVQGFEGEGTLKVGGGVTVSGQFGYTHGKYDRVFFDLTNDGVINAADFRLQLPRLSPWNYGGAIQYEVKIPQVAEVNARISANHRDASFYNDSNTGVLRGATMLDTNLSLSRGPATFSVYANNLLNEATFGGEAPLPFFAGATFSPINKGRVYGAEVRYKF